MYGDSLLNCSYTPNEFTHGDDSLAGVGANQYIPIENFKPICNAYLWTINL